VLGFKPRVRLDLVLGGSLLAVEYYGCELEYLMVDEWYEASIHEGFTF
jgi:hypothetical protein